MNKCFIVTPIGQDNSAIRREIDGLITSVFNPILSKYDLEAVAAHHISETGSITRQVVKNLLEADLVIANLTNLNPNVMYELGIRHCSRKPTIVVARDDVTLPFDLSDERTIFYHNDIYGVEELKQRLDVVIPSALADDKPDNPVYRVVDVDLIKVPEDVTDADTVINKRLLQFENQLEDISRYIKSNINKSYANSYSELSDNSVHFYVNERFVSDFESLCSEYEIPYDCSMVYKDEYKLSVLPKNKKHSALISKFAAENNSGVKRI